MTTRQWVAGGIAAAALLLLLGRVAAVMYADYLWYLALDAVAVWRAKAVTIALVTGLSGVAGALVVFANFYAVRRSIVALVLPRRLGDLEIGEEVPAGFLTGAAAALSVLFGALLALPRGSWTTFWLAARGVSFRESDPYYQADLGIFVYRLPAETSLYYWALITLLLVSALVIFLYALTPSLRWERGTLHVSTWVRRHLTVLVTVLLVLLAWSYRLDSWETLLSGSGPEGLFTSIDRTVALRAMPILALVTFAAAAVVLWSGWTGQLRATLAAIALVLVMSIVVRQVVPLVAARSAQPADSDIRERPALAVRAGYTRRAYDVDRIVAANADTLVFPSSWSEAATRVPIWDAAPFQRAAEWERRAGAPVGATGWEMTPNGLAALAVLAPEQDDAGRGGPWALVRSPATRTGDRGTLLRGAGEGMGLRDERQLPPVLIYPGARSYAVVTDSLGRVAGASLAPGISRLAHAWSEQNFRLMGADQPRVAARIVLHRDARERLARLVPFFVQGSDITPLVVRDSLHWVIELYAASATYPLSQRLQLAGETRGYFRHAATAIIHATTGHIVLATPDQLDPMASSWVRAFPGLFTPRSALPAALHRALPAPQESMLAQATAFARYGTRRGPPLDGRIAWVDGADSLAAGGTRAPFSTDGGGALAWSWVVLRPDDTVAGLVIGTGGAEPSATWLPAEDESPHWPTLIDRFRRAVDSVAVALDPNLVRGPVRAFPLGSTLALVRSSYSWRSSAPPAIEQVTILIGDSLSTGATMLEAAGLRLQDPGARPLTSEELAARAGAIYDAMRSALQRGDLQAFATAYDELGRLLGRAGR